MTSARLRMADDSTLDFVERTTKLSPRHIFKVPDKGTFHQGVQDIYSGEWYDRNGRPVPRSYTKWPNPRMALPSTIQLWGATQISEFFPLTKEWQQLWLDMIDRATCYTLSHEKLPLEKLTDKHLLYWWAYATQHSLAMTDNHAAIEDGKVIKGGFADYMLGVNLENQVPIAKKSLDMSGNLFKEIGRSGRYIVIETINAGRIDPKNPKRIIMAKPPHIDDIWEKPWLTHWAVESTITKLPDKSFVQSMFPPRPYGLPFPVLGIDGKNLIKPNRVRGVLNGATFSPYHPMPVD